MLDPLVLMFFTKEATGIDYSTGLILNSLQNPKPEPITLDNPVEEMRDSMFKKIRPKGYKVKRLRGASSKKSPGKKGMPAHLPGNARINLGPGIKGLKRNQ